MEPKSIRFHWRLPLTGERPGRIKPPDKAKMGLTDIESQAGFCRLAEAMGIDSVLTAFSYYMPDPMLLAAAIGGMTEKIKFIVAYRPGLISPTLFVQQVNTLSQLIQGRVSLNVVAGHSQKEQAFYGDHLDHDQRYARSTEFLRICHGLWDRDSDVSYDGQFYHMAEAKVGTPFAGERGRPEIYLAGGSPPARALALESAHCWLSLGEPPQAVAARIQGMPLDRLDIGLRFSLIVRESREEAIQAAYAMIGQGDPEWINQVFIAGSDSQSMRALLEGSGEEEDWLTPTLWKGAVKSFGASSIALVGSPGDIA